MNFPARLEVTSINTPISPTDLDLLSDLVAVLGKHGLKSDSLAFIGPGPRIIHKVPPEIKGTTIKITCSALDKVKQ